MNYPMGFMDIIKSVNLLILINCFVGYIIATIKNVIKYQPDDSYETYIIKRFGKPIYELMFSGYAQKIWGPPSELTAKLAEARIVIPNLWELIKRIIVGWHSEKKVITVKYFYYPINGFNWLLNQIVDKIKKNNGKIVNNVKVEKIVLENNNVTQICFEDGKKVDITKNDIIISSLPLAALGKSIVNNIDINNLADKLEYRKLILCFVFINKRNVIDSNWIFVPEKKYMFNRISEQKTFNPKLFPEDKTVLCIEITDDGNHWWKKTDTQVYESVIKDISSMKMFETKDVYDYKIVKLDYVYPVWKNDIYNNTVPEILNKIDVINNLYTIGRQGLYQYVSMAEGIDMADKLAYFITNINNKKEWNKFRQQFYNYQVID